VRELLGIAYKNSERLTNLINDILDVERIESGKMKFDLRTQELMPLIHQALEANRGYAQGLSVHLELGAEYSGAKVLVDGDRFLQVMANLISNAVKFSPPGATVNVGVSSNGAYARVVVQDYGPGIPNEFREHIFQKFSQADASDSRARGGSGLGLNITRAIVERLGGTIGFDSVAGKGAVFYVDLPLELADSFDTANASITSAANAAQRILVCEDDPDIARLLSLLLPTEGYSVEIARNAAEAKTRLKEQRYAAMTLDLGLPDQDGVSLIRELRSQPATRNLPIVVVSAHAECGQAELIGGFAIVDWLAKPVDEQQLQHALQRAVTSHGGCCLRVLHVEDDPDVQRIVAEVGGGIAEYDHAATLAEARTRLGQERYDLVVLDLGLPDGTGWELLPTLKRLSPSPPVLLFSASSVAADEARRVDAVLVKSRTTNDELLQVLRNLLRHSASLDPATLVQTHDNGPAQ